MAVFTQVSADELRQWLRGYALGELLGFEGIASGIENSNYFVDTAHGRYVLTLFEVLGATQLPFYLSLMQHLAARDVPCPDPVPDRAGRLLGSLNGKPAALVSRLAGRAIVAPDPRHCAQVGALLARMHHAARDFEGGLPNLRGLAWWFETAPAVRPFLDPPQRRLLDDELVAQRRFAASDACRALARSPVHADLFRDNVLFEDDPAGPRLGGVIDFYFAGIDTWLFDLAVTVNDWCIDEASGELDPPRLEALLAAYRGEGRFTDADRSAWPMMLRAAALRFWISRLFDFHRPRPAEMVTPKDPGHFERILRARRRDAGRGRALQA
jgi:homoserine kinase type II